LAGYSTTPLAKKLGIVEGSVLVVAHAPADLQFDLPPGVSLRQRLRGRADVVVAFFTSAATLDRRMDALAAEVFPSGGLWIAWPKKSSGIGTDVTDNAIRRLSIPRGLVDNKVCAIDDTWSALRVVWRRENRTGPGHAGRARPVTG
jgi:hypothetical protein